MSSLDFEVAAEKAATEIAEALKRATAAEAGPRFEYMVERIGFYMAEKVYHDHLTAFFEVAERGLAKASRVFHERDLTMDGF